MSPSNGVTHFSAVLFTMTVNMLFGIRNTHSAQQGSVVTDSSRNTHKTDTATCSSPSVTVTVEMEQMHRNSLCIILVNITQTLMCSIVATSPRDMKC